LTRVSDTSKLLKQASRLDNCFSKRRTELTSENLPTLRSAENFEFSDLFDNETMNLMARCQYVQDAAVRISQKYQIPYHREILTRADRFVHIADRNGNAAEMLMFGSNNYLGIASHPLVRERIMAAIDKWGTGTGGPPMLNGYTSLTKTLEERLAAMKGQEDAMIFSSGFGANLAVSSGLMQKSDVCYYDEHSHASFYDGLRLSRCKARRFPHNDIRKLTELVESRRGKTGDIYVGVEGVYSMDGDISDLNEIVLLCRENNAMLILDDAHGTGVMGPTGRGTCEYFGLCGAADIVMGTFSKSLAINGGFLAASKGIIDYLRYAARSYMFSAAMPPTTIAAALGALDVIEAEPERLLRLRENTTYAQRSLNALSWGFELNNPSPILVLPTPPEIDIRAAAHAFQEAGIFLNPVEFPAVPVENQRFRISIMSNHTTDDIDRLVETVNNVWTKHSFVDENKNQMPEFHPDS
jgi:8-amino-7-oxononanoate synthase